MTNKVNTLEEVIKKSARVLVTSHISPDPDAVCSTLLLGTTLKQNYPDKKIKMVLEEKPTRDLAFLEAYEQINFANLLSIIKDFKPNLIFIVDAMNFERCSRSDSTSIRAFVKKQSVKLAVIDHHEPIDVEDEATTINKQNPATAQELYETLFDDLKLSKPKGYGQTTLLGIISDTARHKYENPRHRQTYKIVSELLEAGASIEELENKTERYSADQMKAISILANNIRDSGQGYTYSFIEDDWLPNDISKHQKMETLKAATDLFTNQFARNFQNNFWGFVVYPDLLSGGDVYGVSFRSVSGVVDVAKLANKIGGGGHKQAAGAKITATDVNEAVNKVRSEIDT